MAEPVTYFDLPGESFGMRVFGALIVAIYAIFTPLAVWNLIFLENLIPSCLWLIIVGFTAREAYQGRLKSGTAEHLAMTLGEEFYGLTRDHLLVGFAVWGKRFVRDEISLATIKSVEWFPGQASGMAGRDMKDWSIAVWFEPREETEIQQRAIDRGIAIIGPSRPKEEVEADAIAVVDRLRAAGLSLVREEGEKSRLRYVTGKCG